MRKKWFIWLGLITLTAVTVRYALSYDYRSTTRYTCVRCRAIKYSDRFFWRRSERIEESDYSRWFTQHQEAHTHHWGSIETIKLYFPLVVMHGSGPRHPIWELPPELEREFIESASSAGLMRFYAGLESPESLVQRKAVDMVWHKMQSDSK